MFYSSLGHRAYELDVPEIRTDHDARHALGGALTASGAAQGCAGRRSRTSRATAGVSLATVDRVVNRRDGRAREDHRAGRGGGREARLPAPIAAATRLARNQSFRFAFILPTGANTFMTEPRRAGRGAPPNGSPTSAASSTSLHVDVFDPGRAGGRAASRSRPSITASRTIALDHPRVRAAIDDLVGARRPGRDAGVRRAELAPHCTMSASTIRRRAAPRATLMGRFLRGRDGHGRRHRRLAGAARPCRAAIRLPPGPVRRVSRTSSSLPALEGRDDSERNARAHRATLLARAAGPRRHLQRRRRQPRHRGGAGGSRGRAARRRLDRARADRAHARLPAARRDRRDHQPGSPATRRARPRACCWRIAGAIRSCADQERISIDIFLRDNLP